MTILKKWQLKLNKLNGLYSVIWVTMGSICVSFAILIQILDQNQIFRGRFWFLTFLNCHFRFFIKWKFAQVLQLFVILKIVLFRYLMVLIILFLNRVHDYTLKVGFDHHIMGVSGRKCWYWMHVEHSRSYFPKVSFIFSYNSPSDWP